MKMRLRDTIGFPADVIVPGELNQLPRRRCSPSNRRLAADNRPPPLPSPPFEGNLLPLFRSSTFLFFYFFSRKSSPRCSAIFLFRVILRCINVHHEIHSCRDIRYFFIDFEIERFWSVFFFFF